MPIAADRLAAALAARLAPAVPQAFRVQAVGGEVRVEDGSGCWYATHLDGIVRSAATGAGRNGPAAEGSGSNAEADRAIAAIGAVLGSLQDFVSGTVTAPWPQTSRGRQAAFGTRHDAAAIYLWFGSEIAPVIAFAPIPLEDLRDDG